MQELLQIYIENIHPIFPIVDVDAYQSMPPTSAEKILLSQSICMAVSRERKAKPHLCLVTTVQATANGFSQTVSSAAATLIDLGIVRDKLVLIQAMSLTSLFTQFSGDRQEPAELLSRAICHAHTIGLHHECRSSLQQQQIATRVFCCLYALDILNSACLGRPVQLHRRDFGRDLSKAIAAQDPCFCLFLQVIQLMDRVIEIYRPGENGVWKGVFPSFEDLVGGVDSSDIPMHLIATVEVLYHAVAILSCHSTNLHGVSRTGPHSSDSNIRQTLSASRVPHIVGEEFLGQLSLFPFVPYTVALALRSSYHNLQQSRTLLFQERAKKQFVLNCAILRELGGDFYSALLMAELGERLIKGLEDQREQEQCQAQSGRGGEGQGQRQELFCGDNAVLGGSEDVWDQGHGTPTLHNSMEGQTQVRTEDTGVFDPMSFFGIFDDFEHEIESFAGVPSL
ncbi:hypothetical protein BJY04DRAFT_210746 [Aspergillus karnatakaensis]|uniref:fungal specific transcription factor domain-containing protein n=1 Tax=Aspergillus karnatakaensis TaxID=1810916 RepID=UPI003CCD834A